MFVRFCFPSTYMRLHVNHFPVPPKPVSGARFFRYKSICCFLFLQQVHFFPGFASHVCVCLSRINCEQYLVYTAQLSKMGFYSRVAFRVSLSATLPTV